MKLPNITQMQIWKKLRKAIGMPTKRIPLKTTYNRKKEKEKLRRELNDS